jgi:hypothetical protein
VVLAAPGGGHSPHLIILLDRDGAHAVLVAGLRLRLLPLPFPGGAGPPWQNSLGPWWVCCWLAGEVPGIRILRLGSSPTCRTARPPSSKVGIDARTAVRIAWSSHRALIPLGSTSDSGVYVLPVIAWIEASSSIPDRSVLAPSTILQQLFTSVNMQAILDRCCREAMRRLRKSPSTIMDVRPPLARVLTRSSTGSSSTGKVGLAFQQLRSLRGPSVGSSRQSLASVMAMTQSSHQSSHLVLEKTLM